MGSAPRGPPGDMHRKLARSSKEQQYKVVLLWFCLVERGSLLAPIPPPTLPWPWLPSQFPPHMSDPPPLNTFSDHCWEQCPKSSAQVTVAKGTFLHQFFKEANKQTKTKKKAGLCTKFPNVSKLVASALMHISSY